MMTSPLTVLFVLSTTLAVSSLSVQERGPVRMEMPVGKYEFSGKKISTVLPFKLSDNLIVIDVELNGKTVNLVLDSGMPFDGAVLYGSSKVDSAKLTFSSKMPLGGGSYSMLLSP